MNKLLKLALLGIATVMAADPPAEPATTKAADDTKAADGEAATDTKVGETSPGVGGWTYDYANKGNDWGKLVSSNNAVNYCGEVNNQSPINFLDPIGSYGWAYGDTVPQSFDKHEKNYKDLRKGTQVSWVNKAMNVNLAEIETLENFFVSHLASSNLKASTNKFSVNSFQLRSPSEHTVMGKHLDIELQIKHNAESFNETANIKMGYVSIFFSVEHYDKSITEQDNSTVQRFFEHLKFDDLGEPIVDIIGFGKLMDIIQMEHRWIYKGSETFPPCEKYVYWNVIKRIFPIKIEEFVKFQALMEARKDELGGIGNNRAI